MSNQTPRDSVMMASASFLAAPRFVTALATVIAGTGILAFLLRQTIGWAGFIAILATLAVLASASIVARWETIQWRGLLPVSLLLFLGWARVSFFWSHSHWAIVARLAYLGVFTLLGIYVALTRDTIQIVRAFGDALHFTLVFSLAIEIVFGVLVDSLIRFLQVLGKLDKLGPIQVVTGGRNQRGILALVALIIFGTEFRTHLTSRGLSTRSITLAGILLLLTRSPIAFGALHVVGLAAAALYCFRRVAPDRQRFWQMSVLIATFLVGTLAWIFRSRIVTFFNTGGDVT